MSDYLKEAVEKYLYDLSSELPAPGGGSAAAFSGALGGSLLCMVANFTKGREKFKNVEGEVLKMLSELEAVRKKLNSLIQQDVEVYGVVSKAYKMPAGTEDEKKARSASIQQACKQALEVPMQIIENSVKAIGLAEKLLKIGNPNLISDVGVGAVLLEAAVRSAEINVKINFKSIKDEEFIKSKTAQLQGLKRSISGLAETIVAGMNL